VYWIFGFCEFVFDAAVRIFQAWAQRHFVALIVYGGTKTENVGANQVSGRVESVEGVDNVANVEVLPVTNAQLGNGEWGTGNGEWGTGNVSHRID
jgi:hypothetical protein